MARLDPVVSRIARLALSPPAPLRQEAVASKDEQMMVKTLRKHDHG
jgi:hypothetical protein